MALREVILTSLEFLKLEFNFIINFEDLWKVFSIDITTLFFIGFITVICLLIDPIAYVSLVFLKVFKRRNKLDTFFF